MANRHVQSSLAVMTRSPANVASHRRAWWPVSTLVALMVTVPGAESMKSHAWSGSCQIITDLSSEADATVRPSGAHTTLHATPYTL